MRREELPEGVDERDCKPLATTCPYCGAYNNAAWHPTSWPKDGDMSLCAACGSISIFSDTPFGLAVRLPTEEETTDVDYMEVVEARREMLDWWHSK